VPWTEAALTGDPLYLNAEPGGPAQDPVLALNAALAIEEPAARRLALTRFLAAAPASPLRLAAERHLAEEDAAAERRDGGGNLEDALKDWQRVAAVQGTAAEPLALAAFLAAYKDGPLADRARARQGALGPTTAAATPDMAALLWPLLVERGGDPEQLERFAALFPAAPETAAARARIELAVLEAQEPPASPSATSEAAPVVVAATLGTGPAPIQLAGLPGPVTLMQPPRHGRLVVAGGRQLSPSLGTAPTLASALAYEAEPDSRELVDAFSLRVGDGARAPEVKVQLNLDLDACDRLAGARFDPQGVTLGRYPNEVDAAAAVPACRAAVARFPEVARFKYELGRALELAGRPGEARGLYEAAATGGHLLALTGLGALYENGRGVPRDLAQAIAHYRRAADQGEPLAMNNLGRAYRDGRGVARSRTKAIAWFQKAAARGHTFAYNNLGALLNEAGRHAEAFELFRTSVEAGDSYGFNNLGWIFERGLGVRRDIRQAVGWYEKAAAAGQPNAAINLALLYRDGREGLPRDPGRAAFWFADAARRGQAWGHVHLAALYAAGDLVQAPDPVLAARLLARAAAQDQGEAGEAAKRRFKALPAAAAIAALQQALAERGFDPGPADGSLGAGTREAIARFTHDQAPRLHPETPLVDLLGALLAATPA
jgi:TPR repeat protein